jgi:hypothetical protein
VAHFRWRGARLTGRAPVGKGTIRVLGINLPIRVELRDALMKSGLYPGNPIEDSESGKK